MAQCGLPSQLWAWAQQSSNQDNVPGLPGGGTAASSRGAGNVPCVWCWLLPRPKYCSQNWCVSRGTPQRSVGLRKARPSKSCSRCPEALRTRPAHSHGLPLWTQLVLCGAGWGGTCVLHLHSACGSSVWKVHGGMFFLFPFLACFFYNIRTGVWCSGWNWMVVPGDSE